jgi:hypothetical protein
MSNYSQTTFFTPKDSLPSGNPAKVIDGAAYDVEFGNISTAIASKFDSILGTTNQITVTISGTQATISLATAIAPVSGTFTGTLSGMSAGGTGTFNYEIIGKRCTITCLSSVTGTSNATVMVLSGIPAACLPATGTPEVYCTLTNNGNSSVMGHAQFNSGIIQFSLVQTSSGTNPVNLAISATAFTASGNKGVSNGFSFTYVLD